jgi:glycosyltransferase involved in cell wall biosynthesis
MRLTILNVAYPLAPVGPDAVGGAEQVLTQLDRAVVRAGHRSLVLACDGSVAAGELIATEPIRGVLADHMNALAQAGHRQRLQELVAREHVDVVHLHGIDFHTYLPPAGVPVLVTLHMPPAWHSAEAFALRRPRTYLQCVSRSQARACPPGVRLLPPIPNGVPLDPAPLPRRRGDFVVSLGRICPEKGVHLAIAAAARSGRTLVIAGKVFPYSAHERYFSEQLQPHLGRACRFIGPVGAVRKRRLLRAARALLVTSTAPETSSLVAMEALACGTPVIAFPVGALPEIVEHGVTGFLVRDEREMAAAIDAAPTIDATACRAAARTRFSVERMTTQYLERYRRLAARGDASLQAEEALTYAAA